MLPGNLEVGDVVQISPESQLGEKQGFFAACFMIVTELKSFGAQGVIFAPNGPRGANPGHAYYRANWDQMEYVGKAVWTVGSEDGERRSEDKPNP